MIEKIRWVGHASFLIDSTPCIYIDPWRISDRHPPADLILVSHEHYDHCSPRDIEKLLTPKTRIIAGEGAARNLKDEFNIEVLRAWQSVNVGQINIKAVPAYTFDDYHPPKRGDVGFMISMNHYDIYYAGDTDFVPELRRLGCDIAILPVSAKEGLMTVDHARELVQTMRPMYVIPSHYGTPEGGTRLQAKALETALRDLTQMVWLEGLVP
jgi:L-ascorbate metabolism protein UlaG (beta-lactamase superfamily)